MRCTLYGKLYSTDITELDLSNKNIKNTIHKLNHPIKNIYIVGENKDVLKV
jgi:hypothetical protein